jgi:hypothetical protein
VSIKVFLSYAHSDKFFGELLQLKLEANGIRVWRDTKSLRAGDDWRQSIDAGLQDADALVLALSKNSSASHYVTYEWATAMAKLTPIIPVLIETCDSHPKLAILQYMDFRQHSDASWQELIQRVREVVDVSEKSDDILDGGVDSETLERETGTLSETQAKARDEIKAYLNRMGLRLVSFYIVKKRISNAYDEKFLADLIRVVPEFRPAKVRIKKPSADGPKLRDGLRLV